MTRTRSGAAEQALLSGIKGVPPELVAAIEDAAQHTFHEHGAEAFAAPREAASAHEAGHAVVMTYEGLTVDSVRIFPRGNAWAGWCTERNSTEWTTGPDTSAESDLSRARIIIAGLAGEAVIGQDKPGSSLDELALSQLMGINAGVKLSDPALSDEEHATYVQQLWNEQVWRMTLAILDVNRDSFLRLAEHLYRAEIVTGGKLRAMLAQVRRAAS
jgi:hypothetical protein